MHQAAEHVFFSFFCIIIVFQIIRSSFRFILGEYQRILPTIFKEKYVSERSHGFPVYFYSFLLNWIFSLDPASPQICIAAFNYCAFFILRIPLLDILQTWIYTRQYFFFSICFSCDNKVEILWTNTVPSTLQPVHNI